METFYKKKIVSINNYYKNLLRFIWKNPCQCATILSCKLLFSFTHSTYTRVSNFGLNIEPKLAIRLIRGSTYTRVYTVSWKRLKKPVSSNRNSSSSLFPASACEETKSGCNCESSKTNQGQQVSFPNCALDEVSCLLKMYLLVVCNTCYDRQSFILEFYRFRWRSNSSNLFESYRPNLLRVSENIVLPPLTLIRLCYDRQLGNNLMMFLIYLNSYRFE